MANTTNLAFASDTIQEDEQVFELVYYPVSYLTKIQYYCK